MPRRKITLPVRSLDFPCPNCDQPVTLTTGNKLFCSELCRAEAKFVRYFRACKSDGRFNEPDIQLALKVRMGHILAGGYNERERRLPEHVRNAVFERDKNLCQKCGQPGTQIDHINGSNNELDNLQVLCERCHTEKTLSNLRPLPPEDEEEGQEARATIARLLFRVESPTPQRPCDGHLTWDTSNRQLKREHQQALNDERAKHKKMIKAEETNINIDSLTAELDELGRLKERREALEEEQEAQIAQFYTPEIKAKVEEIKAEFAERDKSIKSEIDSLDARIRERVAQYGETVDGSRLQAVLIPGRESWVEEALDKYAESHPEILVCRTAWDMDAIDEYAESHPELSVCRLVEASRVTIRRRQSKSDKKEANNEPVASESNTS